MHAFSQCLFFVWPVQGRSFFSFLFLLPWFCLYLSRFIYLHTSFPVCHFYSCKHLSCETGLLMATVPHSFDPVLLLSFQYPTILLPVGSLIWLADGSSRFLWNQTYMVSRSRRVYCENFTSRSWVLIGLVLMESETVLLESPSGGTGWREGECCS